LNISQTNMTVSLQANIDVGVFVPSLGSAQLLPNGNWMFAPSNVFANPAYFEVNQYTPSGTLVYQIQGLAASYRCWMMQTMYTPPAS
jgi:hypothetical protein